MQNSYIRVEKSPALSGEVTVLGAKNAALVIMASCILTRGISYLYNVPHSKDVISMIQLLMHLGGRINFCPLTHMLEIDTTYLDGWTVPYTLTQKMRASILVMGPLLARFGQAQIALPGGCSIGTRPIDYHIKSLRRMGVWVTIDGVMVNASTPALSGAKIVLDYPSVGATENIIMSAVRARGTTTIINASLEPEVLDLVAVLIKMGARISIQPPATLVIQGVEQLKPITHTIICDRLEAGALLLAGAITNGDVCIRGVPESLLDVFLLKLSDMGYAITVNALAHTLRLRTRSTCSSIRRPLSISLKTGPFPNFPTDLQAPMMALQCLAQGASIIEETVFENRFLHIGELQKMGACITADRARATIMGVDELIGTRVVATDIRASCALLLAGLGAQGVTYIDGLHHWRRGYDQLENRLISLGASITVVDTTELSL